MQVFRDDVSGGVAKRPGMMAMLDFLKKQRKPHVVIIDDISRLARGVKAHVELRAAIDAAGGILESPSVEFGDDADSELREYLLATVAQHHRRKNAEQTKHRMRARVMNGYWCFSSPVGYRYQRVAGHGKLLVKHEPEASIIKDAFEGYASGHFQTQAEVMRFLESNPQWPNKGRTRVTGQMVMRLLTRVHYAGFIDVPEWDLSMIPAKHVPIVSYETFMAVQTRMKGRAKVPARKGLSGDFPLRGFVTCGGCGKAYTATWSKGRYSNYPYYLCWTKGCSHYGKSVRREVMEGDFEELLRAMKPAPELFALAYDMLRGVWELKAANAEQNSAQIDTELKKIERSLDQFLDRIVEAESSTLIRTYERKIKQLEQERAVLREKQVVVGRPLASFDQTFRTAMSYLGNPCNLWDSGRIDHRRAVLKLSFADRLSYVRGEGFRTAVTSSPFRLLSHLKGEKSEVVPQEGFEPPTTRLRSGCSTAELLRRTQSKKRPDLRPDGLKPQPRSWP